MSKTIIITGMHRSGTSMITRWLKSCGLSVGKELAAPDIGNIEGFFEDVDFQAIHKKFLRKRNLSPVGFEYEKFWELDEMEKKELEGLIGKKNLDQSEWAWKDPITCLFLDSYRELLPGAFYFVIVRNFRATVSSLVTREHKVDMNRYRSKNILSKLKWNLFRRKLLHHPFEVYAEKFLKVWIHYYEEIFKLIQAIPPDRLLVVDHAQLFENDRHTFDHLVMNWKFSLNYFPFSRIFKGSLISEVVSFEHCIRDKSLLARASRIEELFSQFIGTTNPMTIRVIRSRPA